MAKKPTGVRKTTVAALVLLPLIIGIVIYNSFQISEFQCTVCISFEGNTACRTVAAQTEEEGLQSATQNACAQLTAGMTNSIRCTRTAPMRSECTRAAAGESDSPPLGAS